MEVVRKYFEEIILPDNEEIYIGRLIGIIESVDELAILQITKLKNDYHFRLSPSLPLYNNMLIEELLKFHNVFHIHLDLSKSIKSSGNIAFKINLN